MNPIPTIRYNSRKEFLKITNDLKEDFSKMKKITEKLNNKLYLLGAHMEKIEKPYTDICDNYHAVRESYTRMLDYTDSQKRDILLSLERVDEKENSEEFQALKQLLSKRKIIK